MYVNDKLVIIWTSGDREVALNMVFMYALNAKIHNWWKDLTLIIWGPSSKLLSEDEELQDYISKMKKEGIDIVACKACSNNYGVTEKLEDLDIDVKYMGEPLTNYLKEDYKTITF
ncbi:MAG: DsrE family protein [Senegalia sp. (in: firmicutes)]|uniref:DsrE family protein n=1 Tax=Senegalia sp. (in: firmicutes) TaxID=1924098 RepID=UPI003F975FF3